MREVRAVQATRARLWTCRVLFPMGTLRSLAPYMAIAALLLGAALALWVIVLS